MPSQSREKRRSTLQKTAVLSLVCAVSLVLSFIESQIPPFFPIPGIKIGLGHIGVMFTLYKFGVREAALVSLVRLSLTSLLFGSPISFLYGLTGSFFSLLVMFLFKKWGKLHVSTVSTMGGVSFNLGEILIAVLLLGKGSFFYLPFLLLSGILSGIVTGLLTDFSLHRFHKK